MRPKTAGQKIPSLQFALGEEFPGTPMQTQIARAEAFYLAKRWREARTEYAEPASEAVGRRPRARRTAHCAVRRRIGRQARAAERSFADRSRTRCRTHFFDLRRRTGRKKLESQMLDDVDQLVEALSAKQLDGGGPVCARAIIIG